MLGFDRGKPFYPLIQNYLLSLTAFQDAAAEACLNTLRESLKLPPDDTHPVISALNSLPIPAELASEHRELADAVRKLVRPLGLRTSVGTPPIRVERQSLFDDVLQNGLWLADHRLRLAEQLIVTAYETVREHDNGSPCWEFLHHCRNAASHGGRFHFKGGAVPRPASWRSHVLTPALQGTLLFSRVDEKGLLMPGDVLLLLHDVETQSFDGLSYFYSQ